MFKSNMTRAGRAMPRVNVTASALRNQRRMAAERERVKKLKRNANVSP